MKTYDLTGPALDWAVAKCENVEVEYVDDGITRCLLRGTSGRYNPSTNWAQAGPIIEREGIALLPTWTAERPGFSADGPTPLIAAMRCYVASKLGDEIELPEGLQ